MCMTPQCLQQQCWLVADPRLVNYLVLTEGRFALPESCSVPCQAGPMFCGGGVMVVSGAEQCGGEDSVAGCETAGYLSVPLFGVTYHTSISGGAARDKHYVVSLALLYCTY